MMGSRHVTPSDVAAEIACIVCDRCLILGERYGETTPAPLEIGGVPIVGATCAEHDGSPYPEDALPPIEVRQSMEGAVILSRLEDEMRS